MSVNQHSLAYITLIPLLLNEQTCRASRRIWYVNSQCLRIVSLLTRITHIRIGIYCLLHSWLRLKFSRFRWVKKERRVNAFPNVFAESHPRCPRPGSARAVDMANLRIYFSFCKIIGWILLNWLLGIEIFLIVSLCDGPVLIFWCIFFRKLLK